MGGNQGIVRFFVITSETKEKGIVNQERNNQHHSDKILQNNEYRDYARNKKKVFFLKIL